jgi:hypothetical protein
VRSTAVQELAYGYANILPWLKDRAANDIHWDVRRAAVRQLASGWKDDPDTLPWLKDRAINDDISVVRQAAMQELSRGWKLDPEVQAFLATVQREE